MLFSPHSTSSYADELNFKDSNDQFLLESYEFDFSYDELLKNRIDATFYCDDVNQSIVFYEGEYSSI